MKILITGASGFIGKLLVAKLAEVNSLYYITRGDVLPEVTNATPIHVNLCDEKMVGMLPTDVECIVHLAQSRYHRDFPSKAEDIFDINIKATFHLLEWARQVNIKHFIYTSSANVYAQSEGPYKESSYTNPNSFYGASKLIAEELVKQYQHYFRTSILRLFTVYGAGQTNALIPNIIERIQSKSEITLAGGNGVHLTPINVCDVVNVISHVIHSDNPNSCQTVNICGDQNVTLFEIIQILERLLGINAYIRTTTENQLYFMGSNDKLKTLLNCYEFVKIERGLRDFVMPDLSES